MTTKTDNRLQKMSLAMRVAWNAFRVGDNERPCPHPAVAFVSGDGCDTSNVRPKHHLHPHRTVHFKASKPSARGAWPVASPFKREEAALIFGGRWDEKREREVETGTRLRGTTASKPRDAAPTSTKSVHCSAMCHTSWPLTGPQKCESRVSRSTDSEYSVQLVQLSNTRLNIWA